MDIDSIKIFFQLLLIALISGTTLSLYGAEPAIENQDNAEYGYMVQIIVNEKMECGGALIKRRLVVTAAHCLKTMFPLENTKVLAGTYKTLDLKGKNIQVGTVSSVVPHSGYNMNSQLTQANDIGLVYLVKKFKLNNFVKTIPIVETFEQRALILQRNELITMGFGNLPSGEKPPSLMLGKLRALSNDICRYYIKKNAKVICASSNTLTCAIANGDSGSPLVTIDSTGNHILLGLASYSMDGNNVDEIDTTCPSLFTDVFDYEDWIESLYMSLENERKRNKGPFKSCFG